MSGKFRRKVVEVLPPEIGRHGDHYRLECGHEWIGYARVDWSTKTIIHPKTANCHQCKRQADEDRALLARRAYERANPLQRV